MKPPKCKSCGKEEWRHTCGAVLSLEKSDSREPVIFVGPTKIFTVDGERIEIGTLTPSEELARRKGLKAEQMRRYRAKRKK